MNSIDKITRPYIQISDRKSPLNIHRQSVKKLKKKLQAKIKKKMQAKERNYDTGVLIRYYKKISRLLYFVMQWNLYPFHILSH